MDDFSATQIALNLENPTLDADEPEGLTQQLLSQLRELEKDGMVERADRIPDQNSTKRSKALGGFLAGLLVARVIPTNIKNFFGFWEL